MKVLVVGPSSTRSKGGMATVIKEIEEDMPGYPGITLDSFESFVDGGKIKRLLFSIYAYVKFSLSMKNYDVYHIHAASRGSTFRKGYYVKKAKKWGKKVILHIHGAQYMEFFQECSPAQKDKVVDILKSADMVIALSEDWKKKFDDTFGLDNCVVLENGINTKPLRTAIKDPDTYQNAFVTLGRLGQRKGTYDLINATDKACKKVKDIKVYLAGDGEIEQVKEHVKVLNLQDNIEVVGWADFQKKISLLSQVSTVILPSYNEGLPMSILEGMACGKAIISTRVGAIPEVVQEENGILVDAGDVDALADAMVRCSTDCHMLKSMSEHNINKIENEFSMSIMHDRLMDYYSQVMR